MKKIFKLLCAVVCVGVTLSAVLFATQNPQDGQNGKSDKFWGLWNNKDVNPKDIAESYNKSSEVISSPEYAVKNDPTGIIAQIKAQANALGVEVRNADAAGAKMLRDAGEPAVAVSNADGSPAGILINMDYINEVAQKQVGLDPVLAAAELVGHENGHLQVAKLAREGSLSDAEKKEIADKSKGKMAEEKVGSIMGEIAAVNNYLSAIQNAAPVYVEVDSNDDIAKMKQLADFSNVVYATQNELERLAKANELKGSVVISKTQITGTGFRSVAVKDKITSGVGSMNYIIGIMEMVELLDKLNKNKELKANDQVALDQLIAAFDVPLQGKSVAELAADLANGDRILVNLPLAKAFETNIVQAVRSALQLTKGL